MARVVRDCDCGSGDRTVLHAAAAAPRCCRLPPPTAEGKKGRVESEGWSEGKVIEQRVLLSREPRLSKGWTTGVIWSLHDEGRCPLISRGSGSLSVRGRGRGEGS